MKRYTDEQKAQAVARVNAGETIEAVAAEIGCKRQTIYNWRKAVVKSGHEKTVSERVAEIQERIEAKQAETREALLARIAELVPETANLKDVATAYGIITDKALLAAGKPTSIHADAGISIPDDATASDLRRIADQLRAKREKAERGSPVPSS